MNPIKRRSFLKRAGMMVAALALPDQKMLGAKRQAKSLHEGPDYTSKVPKFTFAETLAEQEAQLKTVYHQQK